MGPLEFSQSFPLRRKRGLYQPPSLIDVLNTLALSNLILNTITVCRASDSDLTLVQNVLDRYFKRRYVSHKLCIHQLLENAGKKLFRKCERDFNHSLQVF